MKKLLLIPIVIILSAFHEGHEIETIEIGSDIPMLDTKMPEVSGKELSFADVKKDNGLLVIFSCNTCPFVVGRGESQGWEGRYNGLAEVADANDIGMILVNSNEAKRDNGDSFEDMKKRAKEKDYMAYYALDKSSKIANAFGAKTTPHVFLFNSDLKLVYMGAIDDNESSAEKVKEKYLNTAVDNMVKSIEIDPERTRAVGCSIKRVKV